MRPGSGSAMTRASRPSSRRRASSGWGWKPTRPSWRNSWMPNLAQALRAAGLVAAIAALLTIAVSQAGAHERKPSDPSALPAGDFGGPFRSEEHTSELQSLMRISYAVFCLKKNISFHTDHKFFSYLFLFKSSYVPTPLQPTYP